MRYKVNKHGDGVAENGCEVFTAAYAHHLILANRQGRLKMAFPGWNLGTHKTMRQIKHLNRIHRNRTGSLYLHLQLGICHHGQAQCQKGQQ